MNEDQVKPKKKWYNKWPFIIFVLLLISAIGSILALSLIGRVGTCPPPSYTGIKGEIETAVGHYMANHYGAAPTMNITYSNANCSDCNVINMSALLIENGGIMSEVPNGTWEGPDAMDDNCDSLAGHISGCSASNHYVWIVDTDGRVYSYCTGDDCTSNNSSYQDVWP